MAIHVQLIIEDFAPGTTLGHQDLEQVFTHLTTEDNSAGDRMSSYLTQMQPLSLLGQCPKACHELCSSSLAPLKIFLLPVVKAYFSITEVYQ